MLAHLRGDLRKAKRSLWIACPWIDGYFADEVAKAASSTLSVRLAVRPRSAVEERSWSGIAAGAARLCEHFAAVQIVGLERLHAKAIVIDERIAYVGSANFYRYSLEKSLELVVRGPAEKFGDLLQHLGSFFEEGTPLKIEGQFSPQASNGISEEVLDPIVRKILEENPKAWIIGTTGKKKGTPIKTSDAVARRKR